MTYLSRKLRPKIAAQARHRCGYCQTQEVVSGVPLTVEHITPLAKGGLDEEENLWLSCRFCNEAKGILTEYFDEETGDTVPLYNPRIQDWFTHFSWDERKTHIVGLTKTGRATVVALDLNNSLRTSSRALWVEAGYHPPSE